MSGKCWVTRDKSGLMTDSVWIYPPKARKPRINEMATHQHHRDSSARFCVTEFTNVTGIVVLPGECIQVEFSAKVVEQK